MDASSLLSKAGTIRIKQEMIARVTGARFNLFRVLDVEHDERSLCRVLNEMLSPQGSHGQNEAYLRMFFAQVLKLEISENELSRTSVCREFKIPTGRRIDLLIKTDRRIIPIEVKVYAQESDNQLRDYLEYSCQHNDAFPANVYYLTRFGLSDGISDEGFTDCKGQLQSGVKNISWAFDILLWIDSCMATPAPVGLEPIRESLRQFSENIRKFCNLPEVNMNEIKQLVADGSENMRNAVEIALATKQAQIDKLTEFVMELKKAISNRAKLPQCGTDGELHKRLSGYYDVKGSTYPAFSYLLIGGFRENIDLRLSIEVAHKVYIGLTFGENGQGQPWRKLVERDSGFREDITRILGENREIDSTLWWAHLEYLASNNGQQIDFRNGGDAYYELFDGDGFNKFVEEYAQSAIAFIDSLNLSDFA
jgi:hypothetical protein